MMMQRCRRGLPTASAPGAAVIPVTSRSRVHTSAAAAVAPLVVSKTSQLAQLAGMTVLSIDTGDLAVIQRFAASGLITDASGYYLLRVPPIVHTFRCPSLLSPGHPCSHAAYHESHDALQPHAGLAKLLHQMLPNPNRDWPRDNRLVTLYYSQ